MAGPAPTALWNTLAPSCLEKKIAVTAVLGLLVTMNGLTVYKAALQTESGEALPFLGVTLLMMHYSL